MRWLVWGIVVLWSISAGAQTATELNAAGVELYNAKRYSEAIDTFTKAHRAALGNAIIRRNLCNAYQSDANEIAGTGNFAAAKAQVEQAIAVDPENPSPLVQLGSYNLRLDLVSEAVFRLEEAIQLDAENVDAHELLGEACYRNNDLPAAIAHWELVRELRPGGPGLQTKLDKAYREQSVERNFARSESRHFKVSYAPGTPTQDLRAVLNALERAYMDIGRKFGGVYPPPPIQVIIYTAKAFSEATLLGGHIGGLYDGKIRVPLMDEAKQKITETDLRRVLLHEYTHVVVRHVAGDNVPFWLNEGLAETFSGELSPAELEVLRTAREQGALFPLAELEAAQMERLSPDMLRLAYLEAHATVNSLWSRFGANRLNAMMTALAEGTKPEDALRQVYRRSYEMLEREVAGSLNQAASR